MICRYLMKTVWPEMISSEELNCRWFPCHGRPRLSSDHLMIELLLSDHDLVVIPNPHFHQDRTIPNKYYILQPRSARSKVEQVISLTLLSYFIVLVVVEEIDIIISLVSCCWHWHQLTIKFLSADDPQMKSVHLRCFPLYCLWDQTVLQCISLLNFQLIWWSPNCVCSLWRCGGTCRCTTPTSTSRIHPATPLPKRLCHFTLNMIPAK